MNDLLVSLRVYARLVASGWTQLVIAGAGGLYGVIAAVADVPLVPWWIGVAIAAVALLVAQFRAFHIVRLQLERTDTGAAILPMIGLVNEFSSTYWPGQLGRPIDRADQLTNDDAKELYVRLVIGPRFPVFGAEIKPALREQFRLALGESAVERWLQQHNRVAGAWTLDSHTHASVVASRALQRNYDATAVIFGDARFLLPTGPQSPRAVLIVDVVFRPDADSGPVVSRWDLYTLCHALLETGLDELAPILFPAVSAKPPRFRRAPAPAGPSIFLAATGQTTLADFIDLSDLERAPAAAPGSVNMRASIQNPTGVRLSSFASRDELIKNCLKTFLAASQYIDSEAPIDRLALERGS